jgi:hypothetical protein
MTRAHADEMRLPAGTGTQVGLTECDLATVPNVVGLDDGSAQSAITAAGLRVARPADRDDH